VTAVADTTITAGVKAKLATDDRFAVVTTPVRWQTRSRASAGRNIELT